MQILEILNVELRNLLIYFNILHANHIYPLYYLKKFINYRVNFLITFMLSNCLLFIDCSLINWSAMNIYD